MAAETQTHPEISVVIPVFNEEDNLVELHARLAATMDPAGQPGRSSTWTTVPRTAPGSS